MTSTVAPHIAKAVRRAAVRATRAPSVHNTQPWRLVMRGAVLEIYADRSRQLQVIDPHGRQLLLSVGCAVFNARVALAAAGVPGQLEWTPDSARPDFVARLTPAAPHAGDDAAIAQLDAAIDTRQTNRSRFAADGAAPDAVVDRLVTAAHAEGAHLIPIVRIPHRVATARLSQLAARYENDDPAYRAELRLWTTDDPARPDGVPTFAVPHEGGSGVDQCLLLLGTGDDDPPAWLRAGCALERVLLEVASAGYTATPYTQVIEVPRTRQELRSALGAQLAPHVLLRVGRSPATPFTRRRRLVDVLTDAA